MLIRTRTLKEEGLTDRGIRKHVETGRLVRLREGAFCSSVTHPDHVEAGRHRGRLACISALRRRGIFVLESSRLHLHVEPSASRLCYREPAHRVHRRHLLRTPHPDALEVDVLDAVRDAMICQQPRAAIATLDSALHQGLLTDDDLDELFAELPLRYRPVRGLLDPRAESGPETFVRLILRSMGCSFEPQARLPGVGRVDFLVEGRIVIECDSEAHHSGWDAQRSDRRRDLAAASLGFATLRPIAEDIMWRPAAVRTAVHGLLGTVPTQKQDDR